MKLFHEYESRYFQFVSYVLNQGRPFSKKQLTSLWEEWYGTAVDFPIWDPLFRTDEEDSYVLAYDSSERKFQPAVKKHFPVRNTAIELQMVREMAKDSYSSLFLSEKTREKLQAAAEKIPAETDLRDVEIKNRFRGDIEAGETYSGKMHTIAKAISRRRALIVDHYSKRRLFKDSILFPVKIEYSLLNDCFRIIAFDPDKDRFFKMRLTNMKNIRETEADTESYYMEDIQERYEEYIKNEMHMMQAVLLVEPEPHVIERCFRVFSYYDREAEYNKKENSYKLTIRCPYRNRGELKRDILSMGSRVIVLEPAELRDEILDRIRQAAAVYDAK